VSADDVVIAVVAVVQLAVGWCLHAYYLSLRGRS
jgi:hypothetical protein